MKIKIKILVLTLAIILGLVVARMVSARSRTFSLPSSAIKVNDNVYYLGKAKDVNGKEVEGFAFIRRREPEVRPAKPPKGGGPSCYGFLAKGAKWKTLEPWIVNPSNLSALSEGFVSDNLADDITKWASAAERNILGDGSSTNDTLVADTSSPDNKNEVYFADISESNTIAVTIVWGYFAGPPQLRELVEWDQVYDDVSYPWSSSGEAGKMDFRNIATHELGHSVGMDDIYESACSEVTMYGYATFGEIKKQTLELPDITGVKELYR